MALLGSILVGLLVINEDLTFLLAKHLIKKIKVTSTNGERKCLFSNTSSQQEKMSVNYYTEFHVFSTFLGHHDRSKEQT